MTSICNCIQCFPRLNNKTAIPREFAWCKAIKETPPAYLLENLPLDCWLIIFFFLLRDMRDIKTLRTTCKGAYLQNFAQSSTVQRCCFTDGLKEIRYWINPMTVGICSHCLAPSISIGMNCHNCAHAIKKEQDYFLDNIRDWWEMDDVCSFSKKREREHVKSWVNVDIGLYLFSLDLYNPYMGNIL